MIWFTSDLHLGHEKVIGFCNRPFVSVSEMDAAIWNKYENCVKPEDTVYFLGDVSFHKPAIGVPLLKQFCGKKVLVRGNHDKYSDAQYREAGFLLVVEELELKALGMYLRMSHYPYEPKDKTGLDAHDLRYLDRRPIDRGSWLLCGHVHEKWKTEDRMINVGVDRWAFKPVPIKEIQRLVNKSPSEDQSSEGLSSSSSV